MLCMWMKRAFTFHSTNRDLCLYFLTMLRLSWPNCTLTVAMFIWYATNTFYGCPWPAILPRVHRIRHYLKRLWGLQPSKRRKYPSLGVDPVVSNAVCMRTIRFWSPGDASITFCGSLNQQAPIDSMRSSMSGLSMGNMSMIGLSKYGVIGVKGCTTAYENVPVIEFVSSWIQRERLNDNTRLSNMGVAWSVGRATSLQLLSLYSLLERY